MVRVKQGDYLESLSLLFESTKGFLIGVSRAVDAFRESHPECADLVIAHLVEKGLIYPTTLQRTQIRGEIDAIYNAISRTKRWQLEGDMPAKGIALWDYLCALQDEAGLKQDL